MTFRWVSFNQNLEREDTTSARQYSAVNKLSSAERDNRQRSVHRGLLFIRSLLHIGKE